MDLNIPWSRFWVAYQYDMHGSDRLANLHNSDIALHNSRIAELTAENEILRRERDRQIEIAAELARTTTEINCKWFEEKQQREAAEARAVKLREAIEQCAHSIEVARIWDGMKWHWNSLHSIQVVDVWSRLRVALADSVE